MSAPLTIPLPDDPSPFAEAVARAERDKDRAVLTRDGRPVAAMVPIEDLAALEAAEDAADAAALAEALAEWQAAGRPRGATLEELAASWGVTLAPDAA
jgi:antitoxin (DNA-binding transcriptional repressor) of toxin-antitoxin stability system